MNTTEHTELGDALRLGNWDTLKINPYLKFNDEGTLLITMQGFSENGLPVPLNLVLSGGQTMAMGGDYFGGREVDLNLPSCSQYEANPDEYDTCGKCETLGEFLVTEPISKQEETKLTHSYQRLANSSTTQEEITTIYEINKANYIPFSSTLNGYAQELAFALYVKNYGEILNRNLSHFSPWSVRVYILGHTLALKFARLYYEVMQLINNPRYQSDNLDFNSLRKAFAEQDLQDIAHRYQALALGLEFFCFHYYSDHYAAGHQSMVGDLRDLLPKRFGYLGGILVNNIHDELNTVTVYTKRPYSKTPDPTSPPLEAGGDGDFDEPKNYYNKLACLEGMQNSLQDLNSVFKGSAIPKQTEYGGLNLLPDVDEKYRQPQPLFILGKDNKIYRRTNLRQIEILSPSELKLSYQSPLQYGYTELSSKWDAFILVCKLRILSFYYQGKLQPISDDRLAKIEQEELQLNPGRQTIPRVSSVTTSVQDTIPTSIEWKKHSSRKEVVSIATERGFLAKSHIQERGVGEYESELSL